MGPEGLGKLIKYNDLIGSRTRELPACGIVPQPLLYRVPPTTHSISNHFKTSHD
jgi:hypothetical protein